MANAPVLNEPTLLNATDNRKSSYTAVSIPQIDTASYINKMAGTLNKMAEQAKQINNYNDETKIYTQLQQLSNDAKTNQWSPQQYKQEYDKFMGSINFDNKELKLAVTRYGEFHAVDTMATLQNIQYKNMVADTLASTNEFATEATKGITDTTSYMSALAQVKARADNLLSKGIINKLGYDKFVDNFSSNAKKVLLTEKLYENPSQFAEDVKKGAYNELFSNNAEKELILKQARNEARRNANLAYTQQRRYNAEATHEYAVKIANGETTLGDIMKSNLPDEVKYNLMSINNTIVSNKPETQIAKGKVELAIENNKYNTLADLQDDLMELQKKGLMTRSIFNELQTSYLNKKNASHSTNSVLDNLYKTTQYKTVYNNIIRGTVLTIMNRIKANESTQMTSFVKTLDPSSPIGAARLAFRHLVDEHCATGACDLTQLAHQASWQAMYKPTLQDYYYSNTTSGGNSIIDKWQSKLGMDTYMTRQIGDTIFKKYVYNEEQNPLHEMSLDKILRPDIKYDYIKVDLNDKAKSVLKNGFLKFKIVVTGDERGNKSVDLEPVNPELFNQYKEYLRTGKISKQKKTTVSPLGGL